MYKHSKDHYIYPDNWFRSIDEAYADPDTKVFFRIDAQDYIQEHKLFKDKQVYYLLAYKSARHKGKLSGDISRGYSFMDGSLVYQLPLCAYMGFKEIYLIGFDYDSIIQRKQIHFYEEEDDQFDLISRSSNKYLAYNLYKGLQSLESAKKYCDKKGVKIFNAGVGGFIDVFDRVEFNSIDFKKSRD